MKWRIAFLAAAIVAAAVAVVGLLNFRGEEPVSSEPAAPAAPQLVQRGAYLARAGNCVGCHSSPGGPAFAGGNAIETPFGTVYAGNLTPDDETGLGRWNASHFWRAMHNGRSKDGRLLYPAFPYPNYTQVTREDSDAIFAFLRSLPPVRQAVPAHELRWPYSSQAALAVWRALYFTPGTYAPEPSQTAQWNRGAYLVRGLGHCAACHTARNALGAPGESDLGGGQIPMQNWYAPSLASPSEAGVADWSPADIAALLKNGTSPRASVLGPMAEVVLHSTQHLGDADLASMALFLKTLPQEKAQPPAPGALRTDVAQLGAKLYEKHCAQCHGAQGEGVPGAYPALAGNRAVTMRSTANLVQIVLNGGFAPATAGNPRPFGMPPYVLVLDDAQTAAVLSHIRNAWGNRADAVSQLDVARHRERNAR